jgi:hypothetical protein
MVDITIKKTTVRQNKALQSLLTGETVQAAADNAGVARQTVYDWLDLPHFQEALKKAEADTLEGITRSLIALGSLAVATIEETMSAGDSAAVRVRAADIALNRLLQLRELVVLEKRVEELEKAVNNDDKNKA